VACAAALLLLASPAGAAAPAARPRTLLVIGDSLSAEYGLPRGSGWVQLLAQRLSAVAPEYSVVNASISGDTSSGGRARLGALLEQQHPAIVLIELGANDGLRGLRVDALRANLQAMIDACKARGSAVVLIGIEVPPNYGSAYAGSLHAVYADLARRNRIALVPFLLAGFAENFELFQPDHIHPLAVAQARMLDNVWPQVKPLLGTAPAAR